ncbi:reverse transcriptase domain-containing protein [Tanacetum coccineum]
MHNNIMAASSRDRPPMLATGRYAQWRSRFLRYIDTRPNGDALRKCILIGPYTPTIVTTPAVPATEDSPPIPEQTTVETVMNMTPENRAHFESEKEAIHLILTGIGDEIYSTVDACQTAQEMWEAIERLQQGESLNIQDVKTNLFWEFGQFTSHDGETIESYYTRFYNEYLLFTKQLSSDVAELKDMVRCGNSTKLIPVIDLRWTSNHIRPHRFPPVQNPHANNQNNFNRGNNFNQNRGNNFNQASPSGSGTLPVTQYQRQRKIKRYLTNPKWCHPSQGPKAINQKHEVTKGHDASSNIGQQTEDVPPHCGSNTVCFADALLHMPKFASTLKTLIGNKEKLSELARTPLNKNCSAVILNKLPKKLGDPGRFLIPCEFTGITTCNALADLGASINLMPYSVWNNLSLPELTPTCMTLELADRSITKPIGIAEDVFVNVGKFQFPADFVVVDFEPDPRVPLILGRCFLKTSHALIDVYEGEITLRVGKEAITFNLDQTSKYTADYNHMTVNKIDVIDMACDEYSQEVLGFSNVIASGNPTPYSEPIVSTASPTLTPFGDSDFLLFEEADSEPPPPLPNHEQYMPEVRKELKLCEAKTVEPSIDEPPEVELKELPPHLEYAFLEGDNKLPVIIAKDLKDEEKAALLKVLKSHKRAIAWKLSDIKGVSPEFCTHKILMEEDYEPSVQSQRRVNPKIHDVIKKEVEKLLDAGLIYPISDSPWVSPVHWFILKKVVIDVISNEENEMIPTRWSRDGE